MEKLINIEEASDILGLKITTLYKYTCSRRIPYVKLGNRVLFDINKLKAWVQSNSFDPINDKKSNSK